MTEQEIFSEEFIEKTYLHCYKILSCKADAEDLAQEILIEALKVLRSGREIISFYSWYWQMAHNKYCGFIKKRAGQAVSLDVFGGSIPSPVPSLDDNIIKSEEISELNYSISRLSQIHREIVILFYLQEMKIEEIAEKLNTSSGTVKRRLFDARQNIKKGLENNMSTNIGKLAYAPAQLNLVGGGHLSPHDDLIYNIMSQQIMVVCNEQPSTIQKISDEIGVAPIYMEETLNELLKHGFIKETSKGKYVTNFVVIPEQAEADCCMDLEYEKIQRAIGKEITRTVLTLKDAILKENFYGNHFGYSYLMWIMCHNASFEFYNLCTTIYSKKWKGKIAEDNGKDYRVGGTLRYADDSPVEWGDDISESVMYSNMHQTFATPDYKRIEYANLLDTYLFGERDSKITDKNICTLMKVYNNPKAELTENEQEQIANFIADGFISKKDDGYYLTMPVMTFECLKNINRILNEAMKPLAEKYVDSLAQLGEKHYLPHVREDLLEEYVHYYMIHLFSPISYVNYYGINTPGMYAIPEDYKTSAAALCLYIKK